MIIGLCLSKILAKPSIVYLDSSFRATQRRAA